MSAFTAGNDKIINNLEQVICLRDPSSYGYSEQISIYSLKPSFGKKSQLVCTEMHRESQESCEKIKQAEQK